jgi:membrane protein implicated in regulation of membrane protease activity
MGMRASYLATGGILTVLGLILGRFLLGLLGGLAASVGGILLAAGAFLVKATVALLILWLVLRFARDWRSRRKADA